MAEKFLCFILVLTTLLAPQCAGDQSTSSEKFEPITINSKSQEEAYQPMNISYAKNFSIQDHTDYRVVHLHLKSLDRNILFDQKIIILEKGKTKPNIPDDLSDAWIVQVPLHTAAANDDGEITRLKTLGLTKSIVAMGGGGIYDAELRQRWENKLIASIGYSFHRPPQPETILSLNPDVLILYAYDQNRLESVAKFRQLGINAIPQFAWAEPTFLGKAEWLKFTALFFNKENEANEIFNRIAARCEELMKLSQSQNPKQKAFLLYHPSDQSDWNAHRNDFYASFLEAAGAENVLKDNGPTHAVGMNNEKLLSLAKDSDVWIVNSASDEAWPPSNYLMSFKAYRNENVYHYQKRTRYEHDAYDWYETPEVRPDLVLEDLISIFYPDLMPEHELMYFEKVRLTKLSSRTL